MRIDLIKPKSEKVTVGSLAPGQVFKDEGTDSYYMRIDPDGYTVHEDEDGNQRYVVCLSTGKMRTFGREDRVVVPDEVALKVDR